jgi:hypothetical protein
MTRKHTTEEFIQKARSRHGDRYDYSLVDYVGDKTNVTIICRVHGSFLKIPSNHLMGQGCADCSGRKKLTTETFIQKARAKHGDRFDYSKVNYVNNTSKVEIVCKVHGDFLQRPGCHLSGKGCLKCKRQKPCLTTEQFIERAMAVHGTRYDYSSVNYSHNKSNVKIICKDHGVFLQNYYIHLKGAGCPSCSGNKPLNTKKFIDRSRLMHGDRFGYSLVDYVNNETKVKIICEHHGVFLQAPRDHLIGKFCPKCRYDAKKSNTEEFIDRSRLTHGDRYDYSLVDYVDHRSKVKITCKDHGTFLQAPNSHLNGCGCPYCAESGYRSSKPGTLYYVRFDLPGLTLWKIGITNNSVKKRFFGFEVKPIILWERRWSDGSIAAKLEKCILEDPRYAAHRYRGDRVLQTGNTECFTIDIMALGYTRSISRIAA